MRAVVSQTRKITSSRTPSADDRRDRRRFQDVERILPGGWKTKFPPSADLIEADGRKGPDQREARSQRIEERQRVVGEGQRREADAEDRIDQPEKDEMGRHGPEIVEPFRQGLLQIGGRDLSDNRDGPESRLRRRQCENWPYRSSRAEPWQLRSRPCVHRARSRVTVTDTVNIGRNDLDVAMDPRQLNPWRRLRTEFVKAAGRLS